MPNATVVPAGRTPAARGGRFRRLQFVWKALRRQRVPLAALAVLMALGAGSAFAPTIFPRDPNAMTGDTLGPVSGAHPFGADYLGRDVLTRTAYGIEVSFVAGVAVAAIAMSAGLACGLVAGYYGGWIEHLLMRTADALLILPGFFLALIVAFLFGGRLSTVIILLGLTGWPQIARIARAEVLSLKSTEFVESARAIGASNRRIVFREILPNALPPVLALMALLMSYGILSEASLSFLGVGDPNVISLGGMLSNGLQYATTAWWVPTFPGAAIFVLVLLLNIVGDGLSVALSPHARQTGVAIPSDGSRSVHNRLQSSTE
ncbi:MAG TPA: ABC transporter permease [bacterium]|nr:ABC transporter permease [bacterium]